MAVNPEEVFGPAGFEVEGEDEREQDASLAAAIHLYLRRAYDPDHACWSGRDEHDTLRKTCHAVEVLHRLNFDADTERMVRASGNWLINLPVTDDLPPSERARLRLYPSRFKTLAYVGRFDDEIVRSDFRALLARAVGGMVRNVTESDVLTTAIVLDTLLTLERAGEREEVCSDSLYTSIVTALRNQIRRWRVPPDLARGLDVSVTRAPRLGGPLLEVDNARDLSYVLGLILQAGTGNVPPRQLETVITFLTRIVMQREPSRGADLMHVLYSALQLAEHRLHEPDVRQVLSELRADIRELYAAPDVARRWDLGQHTLVLRLLLTQYGELRLSRSIASYFLRQTERTRLEERGTVRDELEHVIRERINIAIDDVIELSGGFTADQVFRVPFSYWYPMFGDDRHTNGSVRQSASIIIKRSTSDAFHTSTENYTQLPAAVRELFVRQPAETQVYKSGISPAYYLTMEDLAGMSTFETLFNEWDQRAMSEQHERMLGSATERITQASFRLFRESMTGRSGVPGTQISRLYLAPIESKMARAVARIPWLKNPLAGFHVGEQRYRALESYLSSIARSATALQPRSLGLVHGDLHARNIMLDRHCAHLKLIDLDKINWSGDYIADLANLLVDICVYRRVAEPQRDFGLRREDITFLSGDRESDTAENAVRYPALARPATLSFQRSLLEAVESFATSIDDRNWKSRFWLAAATGLFFRLAFMTQKEQAAVIYGEAIRLLHELVRHLEQSGQELGMVVVPSSWPQTTKSAGSTDLPEWADAHAVIVGIHEGLKQLGLRPVIDSGSVSYVTSTSTDGPVAKLVRPGREGLARLLLPTAGESVQSLPGIKVISGTKQGGALGCIVILEQNTIVEDALRIAHDSLTRARVPVARR